MSKEIKSHKGGRTERMGGRFTVEEKKQIEEYMDDTGQGFSDAVMDLIKLEYFVREYNTQHG